MTEVRKSFAHDVDEKVTVKATGRAGWIVGLMVGRAKERLYSVETTNDDGRPQHIWAKDEEIEAAPAS